MKSLQWGLSPLYPQKKQSGKVLKKPLWMPKRGVKKKRTGKLRKEKKKEEEKEEGKEVAFRASSFKSGQADPLEEEEKASLAASEALALNKGQGEPEKICNQKILTKKDLPPKKNFEPKKNQTLFPPCVFSTGSPPIGPVGPALNKGQSRKQVALNKGQVQNR